MLDVYPWQQDEWQQLWRTHTQGLHHAILLHGPQGIGKHAFARAVVHALLCEAHTPPQPACGQCAACRWLQAGHHPDFLLLAPLEKEADDSKKTPRQVTHISVDQVRALEPFAQTSAHRGGKKLVLIQPLEALNLAASNALLKTLEEPPAGVHFVLLSHQPQRILPTVRSRCHAIALHKPANAVARSWLDEQAIAQADTWLAYADGAPLRAIEWAQHAHSLEQVWQALAMGAGLDVLACSEAWQKFALPVVLEALQKWGYDIVRCQQNIAVQYHPDYTNALLKIAAVADARRVWAWQDSLLQDSVLLNHPLNARLLIEGWLLGYRQVFDKREPL